MAVDYLRRLEGLSKGAQIRVTFRRAQHGRTTRRSCCGRRMGRGRQGSFRRKNRQPNAVVRHRPWARARRS